MIRKRRSVREFLDKEVSDDLIKEVLISAFQAPSAKNQMPWEFYVIKNQDILTKLANVSPYASSLLKCKVAFVLVYKKELPCFPYVLEDMGACSENILLELTNLGLGGVWLGVCPNQERMDYVRSVLNLSDNVEPFSIIPFGYPKEEKEVKLRYDESKVHYIK